MMSWAGDADAELQLRQAAAAELQAHLEVWCMRVGDGVGGGDGCCSCHWKIVTRCRYIVLTAEKLALDGVEIDDDDDDDADDDEEEEEDGCVTHVLGSSFAAAEDYEHLRDIDEDEDDIDEDDEEVRQWLVPSVARPS